LDGLNKIIFKSVFNQNFRYFNETIFFLCSNQQRKEFLRKYSDVIIKKRYLRHLGKDPIYYNGHTYGRSRRGFPHPVIYIDQYTRAVPMSFAVRFRTGD